jgi:hypothetical protein
MVWSHHGAGGYTLRLCSSASFGGKVVLATMNEYETDNGNMDVSTPDFFGGMIVQCDTSTMLGRNLFGLFRQTTWMETTERSGMALMDSSAK